MAASTTIDDKIGRRRDSKSFVVGTRSDNKCHRSVEIKGKEICGADRDIGMVFRFRGTSSGGIRTLLFGFLRLGLLFLFPPFRSLMLLSSSFGKTTFLGMSFYFAIGTWGS